MPGGPVRSVLRYVRWALRVLTTEEGHPPIYSAICAKCHDASVGYSSPRDAELWAMTHASHQNAKGQEHVIFRLAIESYAQARLVDAAP